MRAESVGAEPSQEDTQEGVWARVWGAGKVRSRWGEAGGLFQRWLCLGSERGWVERPKGGLVKGTDEGP